MEKEPAVRSGARCWMGEELDSLRFGTEEGTGSSSSGGQSGVSVRISPPPSILRSPEHPYHRRPHGVYYGPHLKLPLASSDVSLQVPEIKGYILIVVVSSERVIFHDCEYLHLR